MALRAGWRLDLACKRLCYLLHVVRVVLDGYELGRVPTIAW